MAENKKGFLMYADQISVVKKLIEKDRVKGTNNAGELFLHLLLYVNDENPVPVNDIIELTFEPIKMQLKRDLVKYEGIKQVRSEWGKKGGEKSAETRKKQKEANEANASKLKQTQANEAVTVTDTVTVNDNVINNTNPLYFPVGKLEKILLSENSWHDTIGKEAGIKIPVVEIWLKKFILKLINEGEEGKTIRDAKAHFRNWLLIELKKPENKTQVTIDQKTPATQPKKLNL